MATIELRDITVTRGEHPLLTDLRLRVEQGERVALLGPSGCGKTTLLRAIAGLETVTSGRILLGDLDVTEHHPRDRDLAMIDQEASLQPHLDVRRNLGFALKLRRRPQREIDDRVTAEARAFSLRHLLSRRPPTLSGGEQHEVALARSLVRRSSVLLLDEPFRRIDPGQRHRLLRELIRIQEGYGVTLVLATNDQRIALGVAHRLAVLDAGRLVQVGAPDEVYTRPRSSVVASLVGTPPMNLLDGVVTRLDGRVHVQAGPVSLPTWSTRVARQLGAPVTLGIRPQDIRLDPDPRGDPLRLPVVRIEFQGAEVAVHLATGPNGHLVALAEHPGPALHGKVGVRIEPADVYLFDPVDGALITRGI